MRFSRRKYIFTYVYIYNVNSFNIIFIWKFTGHLKWQTERLREDLIPPIPLQDYLQTESYS